MNDQLFLLVFTLLRTLPAFTKPTVTPNNTVVLAGESTDLWCSAKRALTWSHTTLSGRTTQFYFNKRIIPEYHPNKFSMIQDKNNKETNLRIDNATSDLAGIYGCDDVDDDKPTDINEAHLIVIEKLPECSVNMDAFVVPNNCSISPDEILLTCSVSYSGNIPPKLEWTKLEENVSFPENCTSDNSSITCYLTVQPDLNGSVFICQTTEKASEEQYNCTTKPIVMLNLSGSEESQLTTLPIYYTVRCTVNNNLECTYKWVWYEKFGDDESRTIESHGDVLTAKKSGLHRCEAKCSLRNQTCRFFPKHVFVIPSESLAEQNANPPASPESSEKESILLNGLLVLEVLHFVIFVCYLFAQLMCTWRRRTIAQVFIPTTDEDRIPTNDKDSQTEVCDDTCRDYDVNYSLMTAVIIK